MLIVTRIRGGGTVRLEALPNRTVLTTEDPGFALDPQPIGIHADSGVISFRRPGAVVLEVPVITQQAGGTAPTKAGEDR
jgi:hypothetical protein